MLPLDWRARGDIRYGGRGFVSESFIEHANRYSSLGADMVARERKVGFSAVNIVLRPLFRFIWAYFFRGGFLDGREGLLVLMNHAAYVSWKYAKAWEKSRKIGD